MLRADPSLSSELKRDREIECFAGNRKNHFGARQINTHSYVVPNCSLYTLDDLIQYKCWKTVTPQSTRNSERHWRPEDETETGAKITEVSDTVKKLQTELSESDVTEFLNKTRRTRAKKKAHRLKRMY